MPMLIRKLANVRLGSQSITESLVTIGAFGAAGLSFSAILFILNKSING
jgi:hypothetical protein